MPALCPVAFMWWMQKSGAILPYDPVCSRTKEAFDMKTFIRRAFMSLTAIGCAIGMFADDNDMITIGRCGEYYSSVGSKGKGVETGAATMVDSDMAEGLVGKWQIVRYEQFTPSKEYHSTHTARSLYFENDKVDWYEPSRVQGQLTGYVVLVDDVIFSHNNPDTRIVDIEDLPSGIHTVKVVSMYNGTDASVSAPLEIEYIYEYLFGDLSSAKAQLKRKPSRVTGDVLLTGSFEGANYVQDETAGLAVVPADGLVVNAGDILRNIRGLITIENGVKVMAMTEAEVVSSDNAVAPFETTIEDLLESPSDFDARYVCVDDVSFGDESKDGDNFNSQSWMTAGDLSLEADFATIVPFVSLARVSGWLSNESDGCRFKVSSIQEIAGVENLPAESGLIFADNVLTAAGAVSIEVYDLVGRLILSTGGSRADLNVIDQSVVITRIVYGHGNILTYKLVVR